MEQEGYYFRVGVFVAAALTLSVIVIGWFASKNDATDHVPYAVYFNGSVDGLIHGAPVKLRGIQIGYVDTISFATSKNDTVRVVIQVQRDAPVWDTTMASLQMLGITGGSMIALDNTATGTHPPAGKDSDGILIIPSKASPLEKVFSSVPQMLEEITKLAVQGQKLLGDDNIAAVRTSLGSLNSAIMTLSTAVGGEKGQSMLETITALNDMIGEAKLTLREVKMLARTLREDPSIVLHGVKREGVKVP